jgi:hypothetical protein
MRYGTSRSRGHASLAHGPRRAPVTALLGALKGTAGVCKHRSLLLGLAKAELARRPGCSVGTAPKSVLHAHLNGHMGCCGEVWS